MRFKLESHPNSSIPVPTYLSSHIPTLSDALAPTSPLPSHPRLRPYPLGLRNPKTCECGTPYFPLPLGRPCPRIGSLTTAVCACASPRARWSPPRRCAAARARRPARPQPEPSPSRTRQHLLPLALTPAHPLASPNPKPRTTPIRCALVPSFTLASAPLLSALKASPSPSP